MYCKDHVGRYSYQQQDWAGLNVQLEVVLQCDSAGITHWIGTSALYTANGPSL